MDLGNPTSSLSKTREQISGRIFPACKLAPTYRPYVPCQFPLKFPTGCSLRPDDFKFLTVIGAALVLQRRRVSTDHYRIGRARGFADPETSVVCALDKVNSKSALQCIPKTGEESITWPCRLSMDEPAMGIPGTGYESKDPLRHSISFMRRP